MDRILVIEDELAVRSNIMKMLRFENFEIIGAENGEVGLKLADEQLPELILCDIMMPGLDGYEVRRRLCENSATAIIPFIFLTAKADRADVRRGMVSGADDYLTKPFTRTELLEAISARLDKRATIGSQFQEKLNLLLKGITESVPTSLLQPINQIQDVLKTLNQDYANLDLPTVTAMTDEAYASSIRLERLLQNFLFYALLENTSKNLEIVDWLKHYRTNSTEQLIEDLSKIVARAYGREKDLSLQLNESEVPILAANLAKIVEELLDNAFKFSFSNTPIYVETAVSHDQFNLWITNTGQGLTVEEIENLKVDMPFEQRLHRTDSLGLGIALAKRLTELYGGVLTLVSVPNQETTVCVSFPISNR
ncbi:response regulator [Altericista sp. CCNU0014]|uniref:hybrid sensor histidine kinase/response regulator n=1 Tax=Altericista sp. CCNU0014 TaxID=3082949 RepID=UPI00384D4308